MTLERREGIIARTCFPPIPGRYHPFPKKVQKQKAIKALRNPRSLGPPSSSSSSSAALLQISSYVTCRLLWALTCPFLSDFPILVFLSSRKIYHRLTTNRCKFIIIHNPPHLASPRDGKRSGGSGLVEREVGRSVR